jgi:hypothetical protein
VALEHCTRDTYQLVKEIGDKGMSDEESSDDDDGPLVRKCIPVWRSVEVNELLHSLDTRFWSGCTTTRNTRVLETTVNGTEIIPSLPINCYSHPWMDASEETLQLSLTLNAKPHVDFKVLKPDAGT